MEIYKPNQSIGKLPTQEEVMEDFYKKFSETAEQGVKRISLKQLRELKEKGITTENFLDYLCQKQGVLLHGSINEISDDRLKSGRRMIFASNKSAIAIMRSLYSNINVNLEYPYFFDKDNPLVLKVHTPPDGKFISKENGYVYIVNSEGFQNEPKGSWQFLKRVDEVELCMAVETEKADFKYPVEFYDDLDSDEE
ncbi:MAG TPA: hypothetical protein PLX79_04125 [Candidatus Dojkabacteria bacterium]|nr:hypothetical protein [Candidatus Dojkabacteria bacterium]